MVNIFSNKTYKLILFLFIFFTSRCCYRQWNALKIRDGNYVECHNRYADLYK